MSESVVIVGAGQAAAQTVASLRSEGFTGAITMMGDEPHLPYQRPPLSKAYLAGDLALDRLFIKPQEFYDEAIEKRQIAVAKERGFTIHEHSLHLYVDCTKPNCPNKTKN